MARPEQIQQLDRQVQAAVERALHGMREQFGGRLRQASEELLRILQEASPEVPQSFIHEDDLAPIAAAARAEGRAEGLSALRDACARLDRAGDQAAALETLLQSATLFASRAALFLTRPDGARGWSGFGFGESGQRLAQTEIPYAEQPWNELAEGRGCVELDEAACARLCTRFEASLPRHGVLVPLVLRDQVAAALYADRLTDGSRFDLEALQVLTLQTALVIETLPFRQRAVTPTLHLAHGEMPSLSLWQPEIGVEAAEPEPAISSPPVAVVSAAPVHVAAEPNFAEPVEEDAAIAAEALSWSTFAPEPEPAPAPAYVEPEAALDPFAEEPPTMYEPPAAPEPAPVAFAPEPLPQLEPLPEAGVADAVSEEVWVLDDTPVQAEDPAVPAIPDLVGGYELPEPVAPSFDWNAPEAPAPLPEPIAPSAAPEPPAGVPETTAAMDLSDDQTVFLERPRFPATTTLTPVPAPAASVAPSTQEMHLPAEEEDDETHPGSGRTTVVAPGGGGRASWQPGASSEVRPPADLAGPGWAFSTTRMPVVAAAPGEESLHEEARRLARLLVSEIKLYNEEQVDEGRRARDIYERLKEDIDRSRQMYEERVDERVRNKTDYFYQELVRILAAGDAKALGI